jgi:hypothetical protein
MTYNTNNPLGSNDPRDLSDNAENLDRAANSQASRTWTDRFNRNRRTFYGFEQDFNDFIAASGFVNLGSYIPGLVLNNFNTTFTKGGLAYRAAPTTVLPYTTTGIWASESSKFVIAGDSTLRQDLAVFSGAGLIGFRRYPTLPATTVDAAFKASGVISVVSAGAVGDGVADDTAAIALAEAAAFVSGAQLLFPAGYTFTSTASIELRVPLMGAGATLVATNPAERTDRILGALLRMTSPLASINGLKLVCNHKTAGISAKNTLAAVVKEVQIIDPILGGLTFENVTMAAAIGNTATDCRAILTDLDSGDGFLAINCNIVNFQGNQTHGFQRLGCGVRQSVNDNFFANISSGISTGANWPYPSPPPQLIAGFLNDSYASCQFDGVVTSGFQTSIEPPTYISSSIVFYNAATTYQPVFVLNGVQIGNNASALSAYGLLSFGSENTGILKVENVDVSGISKGITLFSGVKSVSFENVVGRKMVYGDIDHSLLSSGGIPDISISDISDFSPVRSGAGVNVASIQINQAANSVASFNNISNEITLIVTDAINAKIYINNCTGLLHIDDTQPMLIGDIKISNSSIRAFDGSSKKLFAAGSKVSIVGSDILKFESMGVNQPLRFITSASFYNNSPIPIASDTTTIGSINIVQMLAGSPIVFGGTFAGGYRTTISGVNIDMVDPSANPIGRTGANSPFSYIINAVHWSGGLPDVTNFNPAQGIASSNRKAL